MKYLKEWKRRRQMESRSEPFSAWKRLGLHVLIVLIMASMLLPAGVKAENHWNNVITEIYVSPTGETPSVDQWEQFQINAKFALPNGQVKEGDKTIFTLPDQLAFAQELNFPISAPDGSVVANAHVDPATKTLTITYTDYPEHNSNVTGDFFIYSYVDYTVVTSEQDVPITITMEDGTVIPDGTVHYNGPTPPPPASIMRKFGWVMDELQDLYHPIHINQTGEQINNAVLVDELQEPAPGVTYKRDTLTVKKGAWALVNGEWELTNATAIANPDITWGTTTDGRETFTLRLGDIAPGDGYIVSYQTRIDYMPADGEAFRNKATLSGNEITTVEEEKVVTVQIAGGSALGYVCKIKIQKEDATTQDALAGATFNVIRVASGQVVGSIETGADGTGELGNLLYDQYRLEEVDPPEGYLLTAPVIVETGDFDAEYIAIKTIGNTPNEKMSLPVTKTWVGPATGPVTVQLKADGAAVPGATLELNEAGNWTNNFTGLWKYHPDGTEIVYTVEEVDPPAGYIPSVVQDATGGFTIVNANTETISIPVQKEWVGPAAGSVTVNLLADGVKLDSAILDAGCNWRHEFVRLPKYDANDGHAIVYTVEEEPIEGYITGRSGSVETGFIFTNTITGRISVPVTKQWVGPAAESVTVKLMNGATEVGSEKLHAGNNWQHVFADLPQYDGEGKEILYSIKEDAVEGYSTVISGNQTLGFTVTNTVTGKVSIPVTKVWKGTALERVTIHLLADGKEVAKQDLHKGNAWQHTFTDLEKYLNGKEINYSITEDPCPSYITEIEGTAQKGFVVTNTELKVPPTPPRHDPPARIELPKPKHTVKERTEASAMLPRTGEKADRLAYGLGLVILALSGILLRKKLR